MYMSKGDMRTILFIVGLSHSGSTLLDLLLGAHSQCFSLGELKYLGQYARDELLKKTGANRRANRCSCRALIWQCEFWMQVNSVLQNRYGLTLSDLDTSESKAFIETNQPLYDALFEVTGVPYLVDSSKNPKRLNYLQQLRDVKTIPIYITRNPKGQIASQMNKDQKGLLQAIQEHNRRCRAIHKTLRNQPYHQVHYEDLATDPTATLKHLMDAIGLSYEPGQLNWSERIKHNIGGNKVRKKKDNTIVLDMRWKQSLSFWEKLIIDIGTRSVGKPVIYGTRGLK
jgi:hypothetical protein